VKHTRALSMAIEIQESPPHESCDLKLEFLDAFAFQGEPEYTPTVVAKTPSKRPGKAPANGGRTPCARKVKAPEPKRATPFARIKSSEKVVAGDEELRIDAKDKVDGVKEEVVVRVGQGSRDEPMNQVDEGREHEEHETPVDEQVLVADTSPKEEPADGKRRKKLRQAAEDVRADGHVKVEVLCAQCRRDADTKRQLSLTELASRATAVTSATTATPVTIDLDPLEADDPTVCRRCRRSLVVGHMAIGKTSAKVGRGSFSAKLKQYKRGAITTHAEWALTDSEAMALLRAPCCLCGVPSNTLTGSPNGITRLRSDRSLHGMGPYALGNVATACSSCNSMKGTHTVDEVREICRTIATFRKLGDFGTFPQRFRDNVSRRSRSCYIGDTARKPGGTVASKTHSLTNEEFARIVANPCHFCGKHSDPPRHYNGLDRLDNSLRVYTAENAVSCCGTCNMAKGKFSEAMFLEQCRVVAVRALSLAASDVTDDPLSEDRVVACDADGFECAMVDTPSSDEDEDDPATEIADVDCQTTEH